MTRHIPTKTVNVTFDEFDQLRNQTFPEQLEYIRDNIDEDAVGIKSMEMAMQPDDSVECSVTYYHLSEREKLEGDE